MNSQVAAESIIQFTNEEEAWNTSVLAPGTTYTPYSLLRGPAELLSQQERNQHSWAPDLQKINAQAR